MTVRLAMLASVQWDCGAFGQLLERSVIAALRTGAGDKRSETPSLVSVLGVATVTSSRSSLPAKATFFRSLVESDSSTT